MPFYSTRRLKEDICFVEGEESACELFRSFSLLSFLSEQEQCLKSVNDVASLVLTASQMRLLTIRPTLRSWRVRAGHCMGKWSCFFKLFIMDMNHAFWVTWRNAGMWLSSCP